MPAMSQGPKHTERAKVIVLVKAAPVMTKRLDETMCVAGVRIDTDPPQWIRIHPVPFRDLVAADRFVKYQEIEIDLTRPKTDRRPESWTPLEGSITLGDTVGTKGGWAARRQLIAPLHQATMCDLNDENNAGSGVGVRSLAVVRPIEPPKLLISERDQTQIEKSQRRADLAKLRRSLFDDPTQSNPDFEVVPWRFQYKYRCERPGCPSHTQTIIDWELTALWRHVRNKPNWRDLIRQKFQEEMWKQRDSALFVGNQEQYPASFLILGIFWPPATGNQLNLFGL